MTSSHQLSVEGLTLGYGDRVVVSDLSWQVAAGEVTVIVGANACGKSTLLRALARLLRPQQGRVLLDGSGLQERPTKEVARVIGLLPQSPIAPEGITVGDLVARGRSPHQGMLSRWSREDESAVSEALELTGTAELVDRAIDELSGGQRQRVWIAMALAQRTDILLLDEPTTYLDLSHQVEVLDLLTDLNRERGTTIVMVLHELNLAARYADRLVAMHAGRIVAQGRPEDVLTVEVVREVFGMVASVIPDPVSGKPLVLPIGRHHADASRADTVRPQTGPPTGA